MTTTILTLPLERAAPGMVLAQDILLSDGNMLLPRNTTLNPQHIASLRQRHVREIGINTADATATPQSTAELEALRDSIHEETQQMFRRSGSDAVNQALHKAVLEYRLGKLG